MGFIGKEVFYSAATRYIVTGRTNKVRSGTKGSCIPMSGVQVFEFGELRFTKSELQSVDRRIFSLIVGSSVAANDVAVLQRLALFHGHHPSDSEVLKTFIGVNSLILFRMLSAKIYEYIHFIDGHATKLRRNPSAKLNRFLVRADTFLKIKDDPVFATVKELRDNVTHHYHGAADVKNLETFDENHTFSMFLHEASGNSLAPLGEDIGTFGILRTRNDGIDIEKLIAWTIEVSGRITSFQHQTMILILNDFFPDKKLVMRRVPVESRLVGSDDTKSPLLFKRKQK
ncbi:hypothetical protein FHR70_001652 [Microvirga lupini]|uniref:Uncharacterized protein n=1 Tax=Microvirga lupini TaxID=420324 RepID=A0A7W4VJZ8_9HYPH|nr:hypothetical protein [Microvirga lupini]MBB3018598.1 hypothetical protein [Microvirga lupini]